MAKVVVVYHSGYGHTAKLAEAVARGAQAVPRTAVKLIRVEDVNGEFSEFADADAIIFGCPTYMGGASAQFKAFIDSASKVWAKYGWKDKIAAGFTNSGSFSGDKLATLETLCINAMQHGMIWVSLGLMPGEQPGPDGSTRDQLNRVGAFMGAMSQSNVKSGPDEAPPEGDLKTGEHLGRRVAEVAHRWLRGAV